MALANSTTVFDLSRPATFEAITKWRDDVNSKVVLGNQEPIPVLLLANKCDLPGVTIDKEMLDRFCKENNFIGWYPTSAQNNINVDEGMKYLIQKILDVAKVNTIPKPPDGTVEVRQTEAETKKSSGCCN